MSTTTTRPSLRSTARLAVVTLAATLASLPSALAAQETSIDYGRLAASELIVKFRDGTALAKATLEAAPAPASDRRLEAELAHLTRDLHVVLRPKSVTSGGELVLSLDREALASTIATSLARRPEIFAARPVEEPKRIRPASTLSVRLEAAPGADDAALRRALEEVSGELGSTLLFQPAGTTASGAPEAEISIGHLMMRIQTALRARPEVEYSQLNQIAGPFGAS